MADTNRYRNHLKKSLATKLYNSTTPICVGELAYRQDSVNGDDKNLELITGVNIKDVLYKTKKSKRGCRAAFVMVFPKETQSLDFTGSSYWLGWGNNVFFEVYENFHSIGGKLSGENIINFSSADSIKTAVVYSSDVNTYARIFEDGNSITTSAYNIIFTYPKSDYNKDVLYRITRNTKQIYYDSLKEFLRINFVSGRLDGDVKIPNGVTTLSNMGGIKFNGNLILPKTIEKIAYYGTFSGSSAPSDKMVVFEGSMDEFAKIQFHGGETGLQTTLVRGGSPLYVYQKICFNNDLSDVPTVFTFPEGVSAVYSDTLYNAKQFTRINLPSTITKINGCCFYGMSSLEEIYVNKTIEDYMNIQTVTNSSNPITTKNHYLYCKNENNEYYKVSEITLDSDSYNLIYHVLLDRLNITTNCKLLTFGYVNTFGEINYLGDISKLLQMNVIYSTAIARHPNFKIKGVKISPDVVVNDDETLTQIKYDTFRECGWLTSMDFKQCTHLTSFTGTYFCTFTSIKRLRLCQSITNGNINGFMQNSTLQKIIANISADSFYIYTEYQAWQFLYLSSTINSCTIQFFQLPNTSYFNIRRIVIENNNPISITHTSDTSKYSRVYFYVPYNAINNYTSDTNWGIYNIYPTTFVEHTSDLPLSPQSGMYYYDKEQDDLYEVIDGGLSWINGFYDDNPQNR